MTHAEAMADATAAALGCDPSSVLVASTGVIGVKLDMAKVERGIARRRGRALADGRRATPRARS